MPLLSALVKAALAILLPQQATLIFAGDAMMHQAQIDAAHAAAAKSHAALPYDYSGCFSLVQPWVSEADYAVVNLETPLGNSNFTGYPCFNAPANYADALAQAGFDLFLTANNHTLDRRDNGLRTTIDHLDRRSLPHIGTYRNKAARDSVLPFIACVNGFKVGFLNYTYGTNGFEPQGESVVDYIDRRRIAEDHRRLRRAGAEITVVALHWGEEYQLLPTRSQRMLATYVLDSIGADMLIGSHPHVVQPMELRVDTLSHRRQLLVYSLGNFISNMKTRDTRGGAMVSATLRRDAEGRAYVDTAAYHLVFTVPPTPGTRHGSNFTAMPIDSVPSQWQPQAKAFAKTARDLFAKHNRRVAEAGR